MRILHVIDSAGLYGAEIVVLYLMEYQKKIGLDPILVSLGCFNEGQKDIEIEAIKRKIETLTLRFKSGINLGAAKEILRLSQSLNVDIIHSHGYKGNIFLGLISRRLRKIPVITTIHGWTSTRLFSKMSIYQIIDMIALKNIDKVISVTSAVHNRWLLKLLGVHPVVINNGIERLSFTAEDFSAEFPEIAKKCQGQFNMLSIGRLTKEKGFEVLIQAVERISKQGLKINLIIIGDGNEKPQLLQLIKRLNLSDRIFLLGYQNNAFRFIPFFDVYVISSYTEGLPITLLEAIQSGIPIVATQVGEIPKLIEHGKFGELVPPGDAQALAAAIEKVYRNMKQAKEKAIFAKKRVLEEYGLEKMTNEYIKQYNELIFKDNH